MIRSKLGLLGLCAVVVGVMAFAASAAQAEVGATWLILIAELNKEGKHIIKTGAELNASVVGELEGGSAYLLTTVLGIHTKILCTAFTTIGVKLEGNGSVTNGGKVQFTGCDVDLAPPGEPEKLAPECKVHSAGQPVGTVETNAGKGLLVLVSGVGLTRIEPKEGETLANLNMGSECPIGENIPVRGKLFIKDCEGKLKEHLVKHLIEEDVSSDVWVLNKTAEHKATIHGSALVFLSGEHNGLAWSGDPA